MNTSDNEHEQSVEDRTFDHAVRKMKSKQFPNKMPKHVSEMSKFTDYGESKMQNGQLNQIDKWPHKL